MGHRKGPWKVTRSRRSLTTPCPSTATRPKSSDAEGLGVANLGLQVVLHAQLAPNTNGWRCAVTSRRRSNGPWGAEGTRERRTREAGTSDPRVRRVATAERRSVGLGVRVWTRTDSEGLPVKVGVARRPMREHPMRMGLGVHDPEKSF